MRQARSSGEWPAAISADCGACGQQAVDLRIGVRELVAPGALIAIGSLFFASLLYTLAR